MSSARGVYEARRARFAKERDREAERSRVLSRLRLIAFLVLVAGAVWAEVRPGTPALLAAGGGLASFLAGVVAHQRVRRREEWASVLVSLSEDGLHRLDRNWDALPSRDAASDVRGHAYASDLDLFGRPALAQLLGPTGTPAGRALLEQWLLRSTERGELEERQRSVRELAPLVDLRDAIAGHARRAGEVSTEELASFLAWAEEPQSSWARRWMVWLARFLPFAMAVGIALDIANVGPQRLWLPSLLGAAVLTFGSPGRRVRATFDRAFRREGMFHGYPDVLEAITEVSFESRRLTELRSDLNGGDVSAAAQMGRLQRLMHLADLRYSPMLYLPVQLLVLWDVHVSWLVDRWRATSGAHVRRWFEASGEVEALSALATLAHDHPEWPFPELVEAEAPVFVAELLGHPMLPPGVRVDNDVTVGPAGSFLLVTGSNMSGKSTLLRAIGLNTVLSLAGAPVCAGRLRLPYVELYTSIHVEDSLVRGVSFFMAQLQRMKSIVTAADEVKAGAKRVLYLLDEILQGTNTAERRIAATRVIRHLVTSGAIGAVTTHDLELAAEPALAGAAQAVHFRETVLTEAGRPAMTFDYTLRPGVATSTNALKLMEIVGLTE